MSPALLTEGPDPDSILVVEDDADLLDVLTRTLGSICRAVRTASTLTDAVRECTNTAPDLVLLDLGLPDGDGADLLRRLRALTDVPIIVLSDRVEEEEKVALLDAGADDFIIKPCGADELLARVRGQMRRSATSIAARSWTHIATGGVEIDLIAQRVVRHGEPQRLTPTEWALLRALVLHSGRALSSRELWDLVWAREFGDFATHVRVHMTHLRRKVEPDPSMPRLIITEPGVGYRFVGPT
jgi:two-component system KDP operon response regulator KdpE